MSIIYSDARPQSAYNNVDEENRIGLDVKSKDTYDLTVTELCDLPRTVSDDSFMGESFEAFLSRQVSMIPLPELSESKSAFTNFRYQVYSVYHRIFSIVFVANMIPFGIIAANHRTTKALLTAAAVNLVVCGMARLPYVINTLYTLTCLIPRSAPLFLRRRLAKISHYGGIHSGTGVASFCWYLAYVAVLTRDYTTSSAPLQPTISVLVLSYLVLILLGGMIIAAYPALRFAKHDTFEFVHRFSSWLLIVLFWSTYLKASHDIVEVTDERLGSLIVKDAPFWLAIILTCSLISPWLTLRRVPVKPEHLSSHAVRLHLDYTKTKLSQGIAVSRHPLRDWHAFAAIPEQDSNGFSLVVSKAGDWTSHCIQSPPTKLWKRAIPTYGFGRVTSIFHRCIVIATGSGVGPSLSLLSFAERPPLRFIWQTRNPRKTYGERILKEVSQLDPNAIVIDSDRHGRRDMLPMAYSLAVEMGAEAVFVVSNPTVTRHLVYGLEARGVAAYGALFDS